MLPDIITKPKEMKKTIGIKLLEVIITLEFLLFFIKKD